MAISMNIIVAASSVAIASALGYATLRARWRKRYSAERDIHYGFRPSIGFTRLDGMASLSLLLENRFHKSIWAEEIEIFLADLEANNQTTEPPLRGIKKIRQTVSPRDTVPVSLAEVIYKAAGEPQRQHSSVLTSVLRYRVGEAWFQKELGSYKIDMLGLTVEDVRRKRKSPQKNGMPEQIKECDPVEAK